MIMARLARYRGFGGALEDAVRGGTPALVGGGSALGVAALSRSFAPAGSFFERHAGLMGGIGGTVVSVVTKQGGSATFAALLVGLALEAIEYLTEVKMEH